MIRSVISSFSVYAVLVIALAVFSATISAAETLEDNDKSDKLRNLSSIEAASQQQRIILSIPEEYYLNQEQRFIALDPATKQVNIIAKEIRYSEEAESFAKHRRHYIAFWSLFSFMFIIDILWAE